MDNFVKTDDILNDMCGIIELLRPWIGDAHCDKRNVPILFTVWLKSWESANGRFKGNQG